MKKILKKVAATILAASMVIGMTACGTGGGGSSTQGGTSSNKSGKIKIGVSIWSLNSHPSFPFCKRVSHFESDLQILYPTFHFCNDFPVFFLAFMI